MLFIYSAMVAEMLQKYIFLLYQDCSYSKKYICINQHEFVFIMFLLLLFKKYIYI